MDSYSSGGRGSNLVQASAHVSTRASGKFGKRFRAFLANQRGNTIIIFALAAIPLLIGAGAAIDLSRALVVKQRLGAALDAAALAVGRSGLTLTQSQMQQVADNFFKANYPAGELGVPSAVSVTATGKTAQLSVSADVNTAIMRIVGFDKMTVHAANEVTIANTGLELALVLDTTGSMGQPISKINALKQAATDLINILFGSSNFPSSLKIGIVPFAEAVRLDTAASYFKTSWIDTTGISSVAQKNFNGGKSAYCMYSGGVGCVGTVMVNTPWKGCVEARPNQLEESDSAPSAGNPDTLWVPMFQPDEPDLSNTSNANFTDDYITAPDFQFNAVTAANITNDTLTAVGHGLQTNDGKFRLAKQSGTWPGGINGSTDYYAIRVDNDNIQLKTSIGGSAINITGSTGAVLSIAEPSSGGASLAIQKVLQNNWRKYVGKTYTGTSGPYRACAMQPVTDLTNDKSLLLARIQALNPAGNTHIPLGLAWGWRLVSPGEPFTNNTPYDYPQQDWVKAIVLMTDGDNTMPSQSSNLNRSRYTAYGYAEQQRFGAGINTVSEVEDEMDASLVRTCQNIENVATWNFNGETQERIRIYTIAFQVSDQATINLLSDCATPHGKFFPTSNAAELQAAFQEIAADLSNLRLSK